MVEPQTFLKAKLSILKKNEARLCLDVGACLKVNTRALGRGALHKKDDSIPLLLTSERHTGRAQLAALHKISVDDPVSQSYIYQTPLVRDSPASRTEYLKQAFTTALP